jgi:hypothetical protein
MTVSMYKISVPIFVQFLTSLSAALDKAAAHCEAKKIEPSALLSARLFPEMFSLVRQVRAATDHAVNATARLSGAEPPALAMRKQALRSSSSVSTRPSNLSKISSRRRSMAARKKPSR